ncbi:MAG TPA: DUF4388 domain-containing protein, partial [Pyrinomonadaceae bacterium]
RVQRKSGRLQVEYADAPGSFFFEDGQLVDAQLGSLRGLEALYSALALEGASFNFNPLVRPPERSIDRQQQKFISDLVETPRRENLAEIKIAGGAFPAPNVALTANAISPAPLQLAPVHAELIAPLEDRLTAVEEAIHATSRRFSRERLIYAIVISFLVGLTVVTALQALLDLPGPLPTAATDASRANEKNVNGAANGEAARASSADATVKKEGEGFAPRTTGAGVSQSASGPEASNATKNASPAMATTPQTQSSRATQTAARDARKNVAPATATAAAAPAARRGEYVVRVLMEVKNGRVTDARVLNPRAGAGEYEALALRMARQRRYPENFSGGDTLRISVKP